jgi:hypothetical protein
MAEEYKVLAMSRNAVHLAGYYTADSPEQAADMARQAFSRSVGGWTAHDAKTVRFQVIWEHDPAEAQDN